MGSLEYTRCGDKSHEESRLTATGLNFYLWRSRLDRLVGQCFSSIGSAGCPVESYESFSRSNGRGSSDVLGLWGSVLRLSWISREIFPPILLCARHWQLTKLLKNVLLLQTIISLLIVPHFCLAMTSTYRVSRRILQGIFPPQIFVPRLHPWWKEWLTEP